MGRGSGSVTSTPVPTGPFRIERKRKRPEVVSAPSPDRIEVGAFHHGLELVWADHLVALTLIACDPPPVGTPTAAIRNDHGFVIDSVGGLGRLRYGRGVSLDSSEIAHDWTVWRCHARQPKQVDDVDEVRTLIAQPEPSPLCRLPVALACFVSR